MSLPGFVLVPWLSWSLPTRAAPVLDGAPPYPAHLFTDDAGVEGLPARRALAWLAAHALDHLIYMDMPPPPGATPDGSGAPPADGVGPDGDAVGPAGLPPGPGGPPAAAGGRRAGPPGPPPGPGGGPGRQPDPAARPAGSSGGQPVPRPRRRRTTRRSRRRWGATWALAVGVGCATVTVGGDLTGAQLAVPSAWPQTTAVDDFRSGRPGVALEAVSGGVPLAISRLGPPAGEAGRAVFLDATPLDLLELLAPGLAPEADAVVERLGGCGGAISRRVMGPGGARVHQLALRVDHDLILLESWGPAAGPGLLGDIACGAGSR